MTARNRSCGMKVNRVLGLLFGLDVVVEVYNDEMSRIFVNIRSLNYRIIAVIGLLCGI